MVAAAARWPAVLDGGGAASNVFFKIFFCLFSSTLSPLHVSGLKISKLFIKMPRSKKRKKGNLYFCFFLCVFGSGVGSSTDSAERVVCGLSWFVQSV